MGLVTFSNLVGTGIGFALTPVLIERLPIPTVQLVYGGLAALSAVLFVALAREAPAGRAGPAGTEERALAVEGLRHAFSVPSFRSYLAINLVGMGIFNGVTTWLEPIVRPRGFSPGDAGRLGAALLAGGVVGALVIPPISDRLRLRKPFVPAGLALSVPGLLGLAFAGSVPGLLASGLTLGFFLVGTSPVGMQYSTEITHPTPEGTSNGLIMLVGQVSVVFVYGMEALRGSGGSFTLSLLAAALLLAAAALLAMRLVEPARGRASSAGPARRTPPG